MAENAVATRLDPDTPQGFRQQLRQNADKVTLPQGISQEAFENVVFSATVQNPDLLKADRQSLLLACLKAAQDGLLPNGRDAALVVFRTSVKEGGDWVTKQLVQYMPMVAGLRSKIFRAVNPKDGSPIVTTLQVGVVYAIEATKGYFSWERGRVPEVMHRPMLDIPPEECTDDKIVAAYSIAKFADGGESAEVLRRFEIDKIRQGSQTGAVGKTVKFGKNVGKPIEPKGPWVDWFAEMAKKTAMRRHAKVLPMAGDIVMFEANDEAAEFKAADNAAAILGSVEADAPQLEDRRDDDENEQPDHDKETGEVHEDDANKAEPEKPSAEGKAKSGRASAATSAPSDESRSTESGATGSTSTTATTVAPPSERDERNPPPVEEERTLASELERDEQTGITKSPAEAKADELLIAFKRSENVIDLEKHKKAFERHREAMEPEHIALLEEAYERESDRLYGAPAK